MNLIELKGLDLLREEVRTELSKYEIVEVVDKESYKLAKSERAKLNKLKKAVDTERKRLSKELKNKVDAIIELVDMPMSALDLKMEDYDAVLKQQRLEDIKALYETLDCPVDFEMVFSDKMLNKTCDWESELKSNVDKFKRDLEIVGMLSDDPRFKEIYFECLDIATTKKRYDNEIKGIKTFTLTFDATQEKYETIKQFVESVTND